MEYKFTSDFPEDALERIWIEVHEPCPGMYMFKHPALNFFVRVRIWFTGKVELVGLPDKRDPSDPEVVYLSRGQK